MRIVERVAYAARIAAKTFWDEQFQVVTQVDKDGIPTGTTGSPTVTTNAAIGTTTDAPVADITTVEDATARTGVSLWKRMVNLLIAFLGYFKRADTAPGVATTVLPVQNINEAGEVIDGYIVATNHNRTGEISPVDTHDAPYTVADNVAINATTTCFPANAATPTINWNTFTLAAGGKARRISISGKATLVDTKTAIIKVYASDDPNATSASKTWVQKYFIDNDGTVINSKTLTGAAPAGLTQTFLFTLTEFSQQYLYISVETNDDTAFYAWMSAGY